MASTFPLTGLAHNQLGVSDATRDLRPGACACELQALLDGLRQVYVVSKDISLQGG